MKNFFTNIIIPILVGCLVVSTPSCSNFLDVVPDNVFQYEDLFSSRQQAYNALATLYSQLPTDSRMSTWSLGDEYAVVVPERDGDRGFMLGSSIMKGNQSATDALFNYWMGPIWSCIRECDQFARNVDLIPDMDAVGKADWKAQAKFLKGYYLFMLLQMYGPIIIPETFGKSGELNDDLFLYRLKVEDCFDYILNLMDEAIPYLKGKRDIQFLGQPDQVTALAIKARILLYRASPFYNGNDEYYSNFRDHNREHFFAQTADREKWKFAAEAAQRALDACEQYGFRLYRFQGISYDYDIADVALNTERMKTLYDLRFRIVERWNEEIIWGCIRPIDMWNMSEACIIRKPESYGGPAPSLNGNGWIRASYQAMERYYTEHGLPLNEDRTVNLNTLHEIVISPDLNSPEYTTMAGYMQPGQTTINMYLNREPRFYSDLGITGGYYRSHHVRINTDMYFNANGGTYTGGSWPGTSGIAVQKIVHPQMYLSNLQTMMLYPNPIMRVADLWLMKAEALNEYYGPSDEVYEAVNEVRRRAGIPTVQESYGDDSEWVAEEARNKHKSKEGMREIILRERANEFAFECAHRFWDMQRWKRSVSEFSRPLYGWNYMGTNAETFFVLKNIQGRKWSITDYLWPIDNREFARNGRLIQNPGW